MAEDEKKSETSFYLLIFLSFLLIMIDISLVYFQNIKLNYKINSDIVKQIFISLIKIKSNILFSNSFFTKLLSATLLFIAVLLKTTKKIPHKENIQYYQKLNYIYTFIFLLFFLLNHFALKNYSLIYLITTIIFYFGLANFFTNIKTYFKNDLLKDRFGKKNRKFKQTTKLMENEYSTNLKTGDGYINVINPFRAALVMGTPGSGKSFAILLEAIRQQIKKGFSMVIYDFKFNDLTKFAYNCFVQYKDNYKVKPEFCIINFDDIEYTHRSNPLQPDLITDFLDAVELSKSIMLALNKSWGEKEGDFFVESPINFLAICIWSLKLKSDEINKDSIQKIEDIKEQINDLKYEQKENNTIDNSNLIIKLNQDIIKIKRNLKVYCSLPHVIQLVSTSYEDLFGFLMSFNEDASIKNVLAPFSSALENEAYDQLEGQIASVRLGLSRLTSETIYYVMTTGTEDGESISLDINNPLSPKILCIGNNPERQKVYSVCISLYMNKLIPLINKKHQLKSALIVDELPTISFPPGSLDNLIATARSNKVAVWLGIQDYQQLIRDYSEKNAKVIINTIGNIFTGMVTGDTAKTLSERFGKIKVKKDSFSESKGVITKSYADEMQETIPASDLSTLKQGMFAGQVADNFGEEIKQKFFYSNILIDIEERNVFDRFNYPKIFDIKKAGLNKKEILRNNFLKIQKDIDDLIANINENELF